MSDRGPGCFALAGGRLVLPDRVATGLALVVRGSRIDDIVAYDEVPSDCEMVDAGGLLIAPGLIDIHIHGAAGRAFHEGTEDAFDAILKTLAAAGVTSALATTVTAPIEEITACLERVRSWRASPRAGANLLGAHVEGPYFALAQAGAQDPAHLRRPDDGSADEVLRYDDVLKILSFAPELPGAVELTRVLVQRGIVAAAGHSAAREEDVLPAIAAGLRHTIHIWSGQSTTVREGPWRKPGLLEVTLTHDALTAEMIADNRHLPPTLMRLAYKCLGPDRLCLISDATSGAGLPEGARFYIGHVEYMVENGVGMLLDRTAFAGSTTLLNRMVAIVVGEVGIPVAEAVRMASLTPARVIGVEERKGSLEVGKDADIVLFDDAFNARRVYIAGMDIGPLSMMRTFENERTS